MARTKSYPRARAKSAALEQAIQDEGRKVKWIEEKAGLHKNELALTLRGLELTERKAKAIAKVLARKVEDLFEIIQRPPAEGRAP